MSKPEEEEIVEEEVSDEEEEMSDEELAEYEDEDDGDMITTEALLSSTLMTEDGDTVCSALVNIGRQLEMQNRIMVKMLSALQKRA